MLGGTWELIYKWNTELWCLWMSLRILNAAAFAFARLVLKGAGSLLNELTSKSTGCFEWALYLNIYISTTHRSLQPRRYLCVLVCVCVLSLTSSPFPLMRHIDMFARQPCAIKLQCDALQCFINPYCWLCECLPCCMRCLCLLCWVSLGGIDARLFWGGFMCFGWIVSFE